MKKVLITGITGQDGAYLANLLLSEGYKVYGTYRRTSSVNNWRLNYFNLNKNKNFHLVEFDLTDLGNCQNVIEKIRPNEVYNLAAQSFVGVSFEQPNTTSQINSIGVLNLLESIRYVDRDIKFYQASTSEMFGKVQSIPQKENTPFYPRSPYGVSKLYAHWMTVNYRESYNIFATSGILFNHESPLRGKEFVTRKITDSVSKIKLKQIESFKVGNLDAKRDWGFAGDYVMGMWKMMQVENPSTYILATNRTETVRTFLKMSFESADIDVTFEGAGIDEKVIERSTGKILVEIDHNFYRPSEVDLLIGDFSKAKKDLNWEPKMNLENLCQHMVEEDLANNTKLQSF